MRQHAPVEQSINPRFSISYLTSIGLAALTEEMGEHPKVSEAFNGVLYLMLRDPRPEWVP